jgi:citrate lyase gamma subunit
LAAAALLNGAVTAFSTAINPKEVEKITGKSERDQRWEDKGTAAANGMIEGITFGLISKDGTLMKGVNKAGDKIGEALWNVGDFFFGEAKKSTEQLKKEQDAAYEAWKKKDAEMRAKADPAKKAELAVMDKLGDLEGELNKFNFAANEHLRNEYKKEGNAAKTKFYDDLIKTSQKNLENADYLAKLLAEAKEAGYAADDERVRVLLEAQKKLGGTGEKGPERVQVTPLEQQDMAFENTYGLSRQQFTAIQSALEDNLARTGHPGVAKMVDGMRAMQQVTPLEQQDMAFENTYGLSRQQFTAIQSALEDNLARTGHPDVAKMVDGMRAMQQVTTAQPLPLGQQSMREMVEQNQSSSADATKDGHFSRNLDTIVDNSETQTDIQQRQLDAMNTLIALLAAPAKKAGESKAQRLNSEANIARPAGTTDYGTWQLGMYQNNANMQFTNDLM